MTATTDASTGAVSGDLPLPKGCQKWFSLERCFETGLVSLRGGLQESHTARGGRCLPRPGPGPGPRPSSAPLGQELVLVPSPVPTVCPFSLSSTHRVMQDAGETSSCRKPCELHPTPGSPKTPQHIPCLAVMIHFSRMKSAPLGSSQIPVVFGGSL